MSEVEFQKVVAFMSEVEFQKVLPTDAQTDVLFELLLQRQFGISHQQAPSKDKHAQFVRSHPYRAWYLVFISDKPIGAFYVSSENTLGINLLIKECSAVVARIISYVKSAYAPLPAIESVRSGHFTINVAPENKPLLQALEALDRKRVQITFLI